MKTIKLSVIVPAFNEEKTILKILQKLEKQKEVYEVIIVNDASTDTTGKLLKTIKNKKVRVITHAKNQGKGKAIQTALSHAEGNYVLIQDADMEYDPSEIPLLLDPILKGRADVVFGSRFYGTHTNMFYWHYMGNKLLNFFVNIFYNTILSDMETCYKLIPVKLMKGLSLKENDFRIEPEITCKLLKKGVKVVEVPISYMGRTYSEGKKITWRDGFKAFYTIISIKFAEQI